MVMFIVMLVILLGNILFTLISSQARFSHHKVSRIQAFYAAQAGMNYALEQLRTGAWTVGVDCPGGSPCTLVDGDFPHTIVNSEVEITILPRIDAGCVNPPANVEACVVCSVDYTFAAP